MPKITLETLHTLLEGLAQYVMNEVPTKKEVNKRFDKLEQEKADKIDIEEIKREVSNNQEKINLIIDGLDHQAKQFDIIRTELKATNSALLRHEKRITALEEKETGYRVKDKRK